jgi:hypothetical protein
MYFEQRLKKVRGETWEKGEQRKLRGKKPGIVHEEQEAGRPGMKEYLGI